MMNDNDLFATMLLYNKSRQTLELIKAQGIEPEIRLYLGDTPSTKELKEVISKLGITPRELLRKGEDAYKENQLSNKELTDAALIKAMVEFPKLIERPIVINGDRAKLGRPPEQVLEIL